MNIRLLFCALLAGATLSYAQGTGAIHGSVNDPSGLGIPAAKVVAVLEERGTTRSVETDTRGEYVIPALPVGTYTVSVEGQGFKAFRQQGITLTANENVRVNAKLELGNVSESVSVTAEAPLVDSRSSVMGTLIDSRRVTELPINGRNVIALAQILPGVSSVSAPQTFTNYNDGPSVSVSGSRSNGSLFLFDGAHYNANFRNFGLNYPPPDALQEVKVLTNSFSAEYGRNAGAIFNVVTKSGTNALHGSAWEFLRNHALNARSFFAPSDKPQLIQNQFGGAAGGPIRKDKLFVFGSYEGLRVRPAALQSSAFPLTAAERAGDFSGAKAIRDPLTGQPFPNNRIPADRIDPVARRVMTPELMPLPNRSDGQLVSTFPTPRNNDSGVMRVDYNLRRHTIDARYSHNLAGEVASAGQVPTYLSLNRSTRVQAITIGDTTVVRPSLLNQVRVSFSRLFYTSDIKNRFSLSDLGGNFPVIGQKIPPAFQITGRVNMGQGSSTVQLAANESLQFSESVNWTAGRHGVKAGFELLKLRFLNRGYLNTMGFFTIGGSVTGNPAADFALGKADTLAVGSPVTEQSAVQTNTYYFIQDDWRVNPRLTLNFGLRYELPLPWVHPDDWWATLHPGQQSQVTRTAPLGLVFPGDPGVSRGLIETDKNNFAPRFGFAWDVFGNGRTSVRGAYGIFFETVNADVIQNNSQPFRYAFTFQAPYSLTDPLRGQPAIPLSVNMKDPLFVGTQEVFYPDPGLRTPYVQHFNLNVQRQVLKDLAVQVGYVGKLGRKMMVGLASNPAVYAANATLANINQRRILQGYGNNTVISSLSNSSYNGLQVEVTKRYSRSFSRSIDMSSAAGVGAGTPNVFDLSTERGLSGFHATHIASFSWIWDLPRLKGRHALLRGAAGGWQLNGLVSLQSGNPFNVVIGTDVALSGTPNQRPSVIGEHRLPGDRPRAEKIMAWFNNAAFAQPARGTYGDVGRNALIGPGSQNQNLALFKTFDMPGREGLRLQFRSEFFSVLNTPNFGNPNAQLSAGSRMGRITSAGGARVIQFALKALF